MEDLERELAVPADLATRSLPLQTIAAGTVLMRIQPAAYPSTLFFGRSGHNRWDCPPEGAPAARYGVLYTALSAEGAFLESLGHNLHRRIFTARELDRHTLWAIEVTDPLTVVDLTDHGLGQLEVDVRLTSTRRLTLPQAWSRAFHGHPQAPHGILYVSRHNPRHHCLGLFERAWPRVREVTGWNCLRWQHPRTGETFLDFILRRGGHFMEDPV